MARTYKSKQMARKAGLIFTEYEYFNHPTLPVTAHPISHSLRTTLWCGPAAVSAITGEDTVTIRDFILEKRDSKSTVVQGTRASDLEYALDAFNYSMRLLYLHHTDVSKCIRFDTWLDVFKRDKGVAYILELYGISNDGIGHWGVVLNNKYCCSHTGKWIPLAKLPYKKARVSAVYTVHKLKV